MAQITLHGYTDRLSLQAGQTLSCMVSIEGADRVRAQLVKLIHGDENPQGPGFVEREIAEPWAQAVNREWPARKQYVQKGSYLAVEDPHGRLAPHESFTVFAFIYPTMPSAGRQVLMGRWDVDGVAGYALGINDQGVLEFWIGDGTKVDAVAAEVPLVARVWYFVAATYDASTGRSSVHQVSVINRYNSLLSKIVPMDYRSHVAETLRVFPRHREGIPFLMAGASDTNPARGRHVAQCYNGKIDRPGLVGRALARSELDALAAGGAPAPQGLVAWWDTSRGYTAHGIGDTVIDVGPHELHAQGVNRPVRGQTGWNWQGRDDCYRLAPEQYGGVEFHDDALIDCRWAPTFAWEIPPELKSGVYAIRLTAGDANRHAEEYLPFFVRAERPKAPICLLMPTASYLAYANALLSMEAAAGQAITAAVAVLQPEDLEIYKNGVEFGLSTYDHHNDGEGVCYTSYRRPIFNMRPKYRMPGVAWPWQFPADLSIVAWLEHMGYDYEVLTDEDLHRDGLAAIKPYKVVINGTHAEYYSERMLDATEDYLAGGGRVMYLSGNGYYWIVGFRDDEPWAMEVRKLEAGSRAWQARPGEHYLATTGERSGLWRHRNRAPQKIVGTGFASEGMDESVPYRRMPDSYHKSVAWIFEGVEGDVIGDFGLAGNGAAGVEIDRYDLTLGTPPHARILATSEMYSDNYPLVQEEIMYNHPGMGGTQHPMVRCDMVYFTTPYDGAVFAPSSIAWGQALPCQGFENNVSRIMKNVVDAFIQDGPLPGGAFIAEEKHWR
jgi:N,N-dimethylformamidase